MSRLFMHGSGMLKRIPVSVGEWKSDFSHIRISHLELGSRKPSFADKCQEDYLVVELSYLAESGIVKKDGEVYTHSRKNVSAGLVSEDESVLMPMEEPAEVFQQDFDSYLEWISEEFAPEHIILIRTACPDVCLAGAFAHRYNPRGKEAFQEKCRFFEDYFMSRIPCIVIDISKDFFADGNDMRYGLYVSYDRLFYRNVGKIIKNILAGKTAEMLYDKSEYRLALQRYRRYYPAAYRRREEELLMRHSCAVNGLVRSLTPEQIEKYENFLIKIEKMDCRDYRELLGRADFGKYRKLRELVQVLQEFEEGIYSEESLRVLKPYWGKKAGIERQIQRIVWDFYEGEEYIGRHQMPMKYIPALYTAMVYAKQGDYAAACESIQSLFPEKKGLFSKRQRFANEEEQDFRRVVSEYGQQIDMTGIDVWGNRMTKQIFAKEEVSAYISHDISVSMLDTSAAEGAMEMLWSNSASMLVFDIYWAADALKQDGVTDDLVKEKIDAFMQFAAEQYGLENIVFHRIAVKTEAVDDDGKVQPLPRAEEIRERAQRLDRYQDYVMEKYHPASLMPGASYQLCPRSEVAIFGINYEEAYFDEAYRQWEAWRRQRSEWNGKHKNYVTAYPMLNLGDDLFIHMLTQRYPQERFALYVKNRRLRDCYSRYDNLDVHVCASPISLKKCRNHILIGGSMFIENVAWGVKYAAQSHVSRHAKNNYLLGANFGPYTQEEYLKQYQKLFDGFRDICFREHYSRELFGSRARVAPDIVFGYESKYGSLTERERVVISVIQLRGRAGLQEHRESYNRQMAALCREFLQAGTEVILMSFCRGEGDEQAVRDICGILEEREREKVRVHCYLGYNFDETMRLLAESCWIVASRFHAAVIGFALDKTVYPVLYSDKTKNMLEDVSFKGQYCGIDEIEKLTRKSVMDNENYPLKTEKIRQEAEKQFMALDKLFHRKGEKK